MYYRGSNAAVIVYDITNPSSFEDVKTWIDGESQIVKAEGVEEDFQSLVLTHSCFSLTELRKNVHSDLIIHIVGSKADLASHSRKVE
jgi:GTPase SAR1 family protein